MRVSLVIFHIICFILMSKGDESATGKVAYLRYEPPVWTRVLASNKGVAAANGCSCAGKTCSCCGRLHVPFIMDKTGCANITYVPADLGLRLDFILDGRVVYTKEVSVKNPPPICFGIPYIKKYASICLDLYNITWRDHVGGCLRIEVKLLHFFKKGFDVGCFNFNSLDEESKRVVSRILYELKMHQMMVDAMRHQQKNKDYPINPIIV